MLTTAIITTEIIAIIILVLTIIEMLDMLFYTLHDKEVKVIHPIAVVVDKVLRKIIRL